MLIATSADFFLHKYQSLNQITFLKHWILNSTLNRVEQYKIIFIMLYNFTNILNNCCLLLKKREENCTMKSTFTMTRLIVGTFHTSLFPSPICQKIWSWSTIILSSADLISPKTQKRIWWAYQHSHANKWVQINVTLPTVFHPYSTQKANQFLEVYMVSIIYFSNSFFFGGGEVSGREREVLKFSNQDFIVFKNSKGLWK